ncbi:hypothetical protein F0L68_28055 [Solihabitans fulvus]|uniref:Uncharacterized protein n=1 Tax=Solihabitans fulvus TaxID=1892852 RepID=A0A5B2WVC4_9PSEU|nr:hypothetical protein [Solihabitans fulvus]KAA2255651.1 hypothetical protein F0L68_28055 [Solihabitans fulvus]
MTSRSLLDPRTAVARTAFVAAPLCMVTYGVIRLTDPSHGPGIAWTAGHLALVVGAALFGVVFLGLHRLAAPTSTAGRLSFGAATAVSLVGALAVAAQGTIDLVVGLRSVDRPAMNQLFHEIQGHPGVTPAVYTVGPMLFYVGLVWLMVQLAARRRISPWRAGAVLLGTVVMALGLNLIPLGAALILVALAPSKNWRCEPETVIGSTTPGVSSGAHALR